jgi:hypothetical protein
VVRGGIQLGGWGHEVKSTQGNGSGDASTQNTPKCACVCVSEMLVYMPEMLVCLNACMSEMLVCYDCAAVLVVNQCRYPSICNGSRSVADN